MIGNSSAESFLDAFSHSMYNQDDLISTVESCSQCATEWGYLINLSTLKKIDNEGKSLALRIASAFSKWPAEIQELLISSPFASIEVLSLESYAPPDKRSERSVAGELLMLNSPTKSRELATRIPAFWHPEVFLSGRNSNQMVLNYLSKFFSYADCEKYLSSNNYDLKNYLSTASRSGSIPAFNFAKDQDFLRTGLQYTPELFHHKNKLGLRLANFMKGADVFDEQRPEDVAEWIAEFAVRKLPFPCRSSTVMEPWTVKYVFNCLYEQIELLGMEDSPQLLSVALLHACISICSVKKLGDESLAIIGDTLREIATDKSLIFILENQFHAVCSYPGINRVRPMLYHIMNDSIFNNVADMTNNSMAPECPPSPCARLY